jgi:hypothetical protein
MEFEHGDESPPSPGTLHLVRVLGDVDGARAAETFETEDKDVETSGGGGGCSIL